MPTEITVLALSTVLLVVHILAQGRSATRDNGVEWNAGPRDETKPQSVMTGRLDRAKWNFLETYPAFVALALALAVTGQTGGWAAGGAVLWLAARIAYLPLYAFGVSFVRSAAWAASMLGLMAMLGTLLF